MTVLPTTARLLEHRLAAEQARRRLPSVVAGVFRCGQLLWTGGRGSTGANPSPDTQYRIGSITKTFVGVLVMLLRDEGAVSLTDPLGEYVSGTAAGDRTLAELLSHGSGLRSEAPGSWWERSPGLDVAALNGSLDGSALKHPAGRCYHYSNVGMALLGQVIERVRGRDWFAVLTDEVLVPLGMDRTTLEPVDPRAHGYAVHPHADVLLPEPDTGTRAMAPAGQLWSTVNDLARWGALLAGDTGGVLDPATLAEMRHPVNVEDGPEWTYTYGLGVGLWRERGHRLAGHGGSMPGFLANLVVDEDDGTGVVTMANATTGLSDGLHLDMLDVMARHEPALPPEWSPSPVPERVLDIVGTWYWGPVPYVLAALPEGLLELRRTRDDVPSRFRATRDGTWHGLDGYFAGETLRAVRTTGGAVSHLDVATFCFTRTPYQPDAPIPGGVDDAGWRSGGK